MALTLADFEDLLSGDLSIFELISRKVSAWSGTPDNTHYPTEKLVYDSLALKLDASALATTLLDYARLSINNAWTKAQRTNTVTLTSSAGSVAIDLNASNTFTYTPTENATLANPTNANVGQAGNITFTQHASSAKTLAFGTYWKSSTGGTQLVSSTLSSLNSIEYRVLSPTYIIYTIVKCGVT